MMDQTEVPCWQRPFTSHPRCAVALLRHNEGVTVDAVAPAGSTGRNDDSMPVSPDIPVTARHTQYPAHGFNAEFSLVLFS